MILLVFACGSEELVEPLVAAKLDRLEEILPLSTRLGLGSVGLAAAVCPMSHQDWIDLANGDAEDADGAYLSVSDELREMLGLEASTAYGDGLVRYDEASRAATVTWNRVEIEDGWDLTTLELTMLSAWAHFRVTVDPVEDLDSVEVDASFVDCDTKAQLEQAAGAWERGGAEESFHLPPEDFEAEDESDHPYWIGGKPWPEQGRFAWKRSADDEETVKVTSLDAGQIDGSAWPVTVTTRSWSAEIEIPLTR